MSVFYQALAPTPVDEVETPTSEEQREVEYTIRSLLVPYQQSMLDGSKASASSSSALLEVGAVPVPKLNKKLHMAFLAKILDPLPAPYVGFDSTRCWLIYWVAHSHYLMGMELSESTRTRAISTLLHFQDRKVGGFGSGKGQIGHLMGTYAAVMALAVVGGPGGCPDDDDVRVGQSTSVGKGGWDDIDRPLLYSFLLSLKQPDGSFTVHAEGEIDIRATYCVICVSLMLGIATPELFEGVGQAIANCQTYEGGLSAASYPFSPQEADGVTLGEAHGGYAFCGMASHLSLSLLPNTTQPSISPFRHIAEHLSSSDAVPSEGDMEWTNLASASSSHLDVDKAVRWAVSQQGIPVEGGGFRGRTNKLVDGCYGWFSGGGMFTILSALTDLKYGAWWRDEEQESESKDESSGDSIDDWESVGDDESLINNAPDGYLFDRIALQEYILVVAQNPSGGLRDKPGKNSDAYHTCYNLSGLSMCQHQVQIDAALMQRHHQRYRTSGESNAGARGTDLQEWQRCCYSSAQGWSVDRKAQCVLGGSSNQVAITHPIFNIGLRKAEAIINWAYDQL